jgi:hypothetical protein
VLQFIKRLFGIVNPQKTEEQVSASSAGRSPSAQIGRLDSKCPYCEAELQIRPKAKCRCKACGNFIRVRWDAEDRSTLLREDQLEAFSEQKYSQPKYAEFQEAVDEMTIIPFVGDDKWTKASMLAKALQIAEKYPDIADKPALAAFFVEHFGARYESLVDSVTQQFNVPRSRAILISRHVESVISAYYRQLRHQRADGKKYVWRALPTACLRCQELDGKVFLWDDPPEGGHPGECECWRLTSPDYDKVPMGRLDSRCPTCEIELTKRPRAKSKCKNCRNEIWVKTNTEGQQVLLNEEMLADFDRQKDGPEICRCFARPIVDLFD